MKRFVQQEDSFVLAFYRRMFSTKQMKGAVLDWLRGSTIFEVAIVTFRKLFFSFLVRSLDRELVVVLRGCTSYGGCSIFESGDISRCEEGKGDTCTRLFL